MLAREVLLPPTELARGRFVFFGAIFPSPLQNI
jgi:hypothetical protein